MEAFPLQWPMGYKRTNQRTDSQFKITMERAQQFLRDEIRRMKASSLIVSTNIPIRKDGMMYVDYMNKRINDPGTRWSYKFHDWTADKM